MLDTQVLSFALVTEPAASAQHRQLQEDASDLLGSLSEVRVSSLVVFELLRSPPDVVARIKVSGILDELQVEALDQRISAEAARILEVARTNEDTCKLCFNIKRATVCRSCNQMVSVQQRTHDALILATASQLTDVHTLYTFDPGMIELGRFVKTVEVLTPPNRYGPLFGRP